MGFSSWGMSWSFGDLTDVKVPDYAEALIGYRMWFIGSVGDLTSPVTNVGWPVGAPLKAECARGCGSCPSPTNEDHGGYGCGLYAWSSFELFAEHGYRSAALSGVMKRNMAIGTCLLWGTVQEQEFGYRSEFAMVNSLYSTHSNVNRIAAAYGVELLPTPSGLTYKGKR